MIPLNVTHTAIVSTEVHCALLDPNTAIVSPEGGSAGKLPAASTPLRHTLSTLISFFASAYKAVFGFEKGPPLHDALTIFYLSNPEAFKCIRYRVDIELRGDHSVGQTVVDVWNYQSSHEGWGVGGKNCIVAEAMDVSPKTYVYLGYRF